ncbi:unnamed protein product [Mytilus coruscus]|uniref:Fibronectin type-III domain-containing protein n=1 Tax=Mytilus coruscus TaxID=42192 RepID=A0A6J8ERG5_MYTCO|nr:unnamed protein product [Mytilus coruscus]
MGCARQMFNQNIWESLGDLPAPELKHGSKGYSFLTLHWSGPINNNVTYYIQSRVLDTNGDWSIYGGSLVQPNGDLKITGLQPFMNYTFRISLVITTTEVLYTKESEIITTLPHGVPSAPIITEISAPTCSVISLSWKPPVYTNGHLLSYRLYLKPINNNDVRDTSMEVPPHVTSWTFRQLKSSQEYVVAMTARNQDGEGQTDRANMTTPSSSNLLKNDVYLVLAEDNKVIKKDMTEFFSSPQTIHKRLNASDLIKGMYSKT